MNSLVRRSKTGLWPVCRLQVDGIFQWDSNEQGVILASFYYGYILVPFVSAALAMKFGGKLLMMVGQLLVAVMTILTPVLTTVGDLPALVILRVIEGVAQVRALRCVLVVAFTD